MTKTAKQFRADLDPFRYAFIMERMREHNTSIGDLIIDALIYLFADKQRPKPECLVRLNKTFRELKGSVQHPDDKGVSNSRAGKVNFGTTFPAEFIDDVNEAIKDLGYSQQQVVDEYIDVLLSSSPDWDDDVTVEALAGVSDFMDTEYRRGKNEKHDLALLAYRYHEDKSLSIDEYRAEKKAIQDRLHKERRPSLGP